MATITDPERDRLSKFNTLLSSSSFLLVYKIRSLPPFIPSPFSSLSRPFLTPKSLPRLLVPLVYVLPVLSPHPLVLSLKLRRENPSDNLRTLPLSTNDKKRKGGYEGEMIIDTENILASYFREKGWFGIVIDKNSVSEKRGYR